jgi:hypothetical protein
MRLLRTQMSTADLSATRGSPMPMPAALDSQMPASPAIEERVVEVVGGIDERAPESGAPAPRLDALAHRYLGHPSWWRLIALVNGVVDPLRVSARVLRIPGAATTEEPR